MFTPDTTPRTSFISTHLAAFEIEADGMVRTGRLTRDHADDMVFMRSTLLEFVWDIKLLCTKQKKKTISVDDVKKSFGVSVTQQFFEDLLADCVTCGYIRMMALDNSRYIASAI